MKHQNPAIISISNNASQNLDGGVGNKNEAYVKGGVPSNRNNDMFTFVTADLKDEFISSRIFQIVEYVRDRLLKPCSGIKRTKSSLLKEYEKQKLKWLVVYILQ